MINKNQAEEIFKHLAFKTKNYDELSKEFGLHKTTLCKQMKQYKEDFGLKSDERYCAKTYLKYKYKNEIINQYLNGESTKKIAERYNLKDDHLIATLLRELGIEIRSVGYQSKTNQTLFSNISDEITAYTLGLITADGNVGNNYMISIHLTETDKYLLEKINQQLFNNTGSFLLTPKENGKSVCRLSICGKQICENLKQYNVVPNKSHILEKLFIFPEPLMKHYIRGLYDGDGVCSKSNNYLRVGFCSYKKEFCESFQNYLVEQLNIKKNQLFNTGNCWHCSWGDKEELKKIYHYLYDDATISLNRKKEKLYSYLYGNTEVTS